MLRDTRRWEHYRKKRTSYWGRVLLGALLLLVGGITGYAQLLGASALPKGIVILLGLFGAPFGVFLIFYGVFKSRSP